MDDNWSRNHVICRRMTNLKRTIFQGGDGTTRSAMILKCGKFSISVDGFQMIIWLTVTLTIVFRVFEMMRIRFGKQLAPVTAIKIHRLNDETIEVGFPLSTIIDCNQSHTHLKDILTQFVWPLYKLWLASAILATSWEQPTEFSEWLRWSVAKDFPLFMKSRINLKVKLLRIPTI